MKKKIAKFSVLPVLGASVLFYSFTVQKRLAFDEALAARFAAPVEQEYHEVPEASSGLTKKSHFQLGKSYIAFKEALGFKESGGDYQVVNEFGYLGKYQFGVGTLEMIGIRDTIAFLASPQLQEAAFYANTARNKWILRKDIYKYQNQVIDGVKITESGILAAAHLAGAGNVKKFLRSGGANSFRDGFGTSIKYYFRKFADFDTSPIVAEKTARVSLAAAR